MTFDDVVKLFDNYSRRARLYPAIIAMAPALWTCAAVFPGVFGDGPVHAATAIVVGCGGLYWLSNVARARGKSLEPGLIAEWGGLPTTILLRHRDGFIDRYTKARYHQKLSQLAPDIYLPTEAGEAADHSDADAKYQSVVRRLLEIRRGAEFGLVHKENAIYGFWRNLLGLKPFGLTLALISLLVVGFSCAAPYVASGAAALTSAALTQDFHARWPVWFAAFADVAASTVWLLSVNGRAVRHAGNQYAVALLRTLDA